MQHNFGTNANWNRAFWAARFDEPLWGCAIISQGMATIVLPPVGAPDRLQALATKLRDRLQGHSG